jgi:hypothetical protein
MKKKVLVTHVRPHLDDIAGIWLFQKYLPGWKDARVHFIPTTNKGGKPYGGKPVDTDPNIFHIGIGRGKFDEHKGNIGESAATLIHQEIKRKKQLPKTLIERKALERVIEYVLEGDLGQRHGLPGWAYEFGTVIMWIPDSKERTRAGIVMLDALLSFFEDYEKLSKDWKKKKIFKTQWGRGVGIISDKRATIRIYDEGYVLAAQVDPKRGYRSIRAHANSRVDLTAAYKKAIALEPKADWYLHHSKRMLICGSEVAPQSIRSRLTLEQLIDLVKA